MQTEGGKKWEKRKKTVEKEKINEKRRNIIYKKQRKIYERNKNGNHSFEHKMFLRNLFLKNDRALFLRKCQLESHFSSNTDDFASFY